MSKMYFDIVKFTLKFGNHESYADNVNIYKSKGIGRITVTVQ